MEGEIKAAKSANDREELKALRDKEKQLRDKENKLIDKEKQLRDLRKLLLERQASPSGKPAVGLSFGGIGVTGGAHSSPPFPRPFSRSRITGGLLEGADACRAQCRRQGVGAGGGYLFPR